ncbi:DUF4476 domain-containing protein [Siphonobacter sp. SORGH_AS_0500]|uniref:DUF4476 domain-containing protein n=1 Tax=Siphonobacter sp. SORGH_AS_0500 TaxID=1864824 RepID=UPI0028653044|nr:DUF4476 domain-containing protein [Siphonobacter sp. SORGH_AS_0500]MDR6194280.1 hypothetical protein [Siphonobacter sp. SORGH_AS_0500]
MRTKKLIVFSALLAMLSWSNAFADVEFFLETPIGGRLTVMVNDQSITNATGRYRFFDLDPGRAQVTVYQGRNVMFRQVVMLNPETRTMAILHPQYGFRIQKTIPVHTGEMNRSYQYQPQQEPDQMRQLPDENVNPNANRLMPGSKPTEETMKQNRSQEMPAKSDEVMTADQLEQYLKAIQRTAKEKRLDFMKQTLAKQVFNVQQLTEIIKQFDTPKERLEVAKLGWDSVVDRSNFEIIYDQFSFDSDQKELRAYCEGM